MTTLEESPRYWVCTRLDVINLYELTDIWEMGNSLAIRRIYPHTLGDCGITKECLDKAYRPATDIEVALYA